MKHVMTADAGKLEVWDAAANVTSPVCSVMAHNAAIVHIVVCQHNHISFNSKRITTKICMKSQLQLQILSQFDDNFLYS